MGSGLAYERPTAGATAVAVDYERHALQRLAPVVASVRVFRAVAHSCKFTIYLFCLVFSRKFNIKRGLFAHQSPTLPQKIDSREGLF